MTPDEGLPEYKNPPVSEVITGVYFKKIPFQLPHFGLLWEQFRNDYPRFEEATPLVTDVTLAGTPDFPMPRVWFVSADQTGVIQVQHSYFLTNWRKVKSDDSYPRYHKVMKEYRNRLERFTKFLESHELPSIEPVQYEMTYVNHIPQGQGWNDLGDVGRIFPDVSWRNETGRFFGVYETLSYAAAFSLPNGMGRLRAAIRSARRREDNVPVFTLELTARGKPEAGSEADPWDWYAIAREWIVRGFADLTSEEVQKTIWERVR